MVMVKMDVNGHEVTFIKDSATLTGRDAVQLVDHVKYVEATHAELVTVKNAKDMGN